MLYHYAVDGVFTGRVTQDDDQPFARTTTVAPPAATPGQQAVWVGDRWILRAVFVPDAAPAAAPLRALRADAFFLRFTDTEWRDIQLNAADVPTAAAAQRQRQAQLRAFIDRVKMSPRINLDDGRLRALVNAMENFGVLDAGRAVQLLHDATQEEA